MLLQCYYYFYPYYDCRLLLNELLKSPRTLLDIERPPCCSFFLKSLYPCLQHTDCFYHSVLLLHTTTEKYFHSGPANEHIHTWEWPPTTISIRDQLASPGGAIPFFSTQRSHGHPSPLPLSQLGLLRTTTLLPLPTCAVCRHSHTFSWPGDHALTMKTSSGFVLYPCGPGKLD